MISTWIGKINQAKEPVINFFTWSPFRKVVKKKNKNNDEFLPSYNNFKKALDGSGIKWVSVNFIKVSFISTLTTTLPMTLLGLALPQALLAGAGVSIISSLISYNKDKKEKLRTNPNSYLLEVDKGI